MPGWVDFKGHLARSSGDICWLIEGLIVVGLLEELRVVLLDLLVYLRCSSAF